MANDQLEEAAHINAPPIDQSGLLTPSQADGHWTPETERETADLQSVLATLPDRPQTASTSPLPFFHLLERLKTTKREGWRRFNINHGESIGDHMYRMAIITLLCPPSLASKLDIARCTRMALVHDMAEALVGDITPVDGVSKTEKSRREAETMDYLCSGLLGKVHAGSGQAEAIREVWQEYEDSQTPESHFVHDVDKMELLLQMMEYERSQEGRTDLGEFTRVAARIVTPEVQVWARELLEERASFWRSVGATPKGVLEIGNAGSAIEGHDGVSEERKRQQDEYYGNGHAKAQKLDEVGEPNGTVPEGKS